MSRCKEEDAFMRNRESVAAIVESTSQTLTISNLSEVSVLALVTALAASGFNVTARSTSKSNFKLEASRLMPPIEYLTNNQVH